MLSRRKLLVGAGTLPALSFTQGKAEVFSYATALLFGGPAQGAALFATQSAALASNFTINGQSKLSQYQSVGGDAINGYSLIGGYSPSVNFSTYIHALGVPQTIQRIITITDPTLMENNKPYSNFYIDIIPPGIGITLFDVVAGKFVTTHGSDPWLHILTQTGTGGTRRVTSFVAQLWRFWPGSWMNLSIMQNDAATAGAAAISILQFIQGEQRSSLDVLRTFTGFPASYTPPASLSNGQQFKVIVPWGMTGSNTQLDVTIGAPPGSYGGGLSGMSLESTIFQPALPADPLWVTSSVVRPGTGMSMGDGGIRFKQPSIGAPNFFYSGTGPASIHGTGGVPPPGVNLGWFTNSGAGDFNINGDYIFMDTSLGIPPGQTRIQPVSDDVGSAFD